MDGDCDPVERCEAILEAVCAGRIAPNEAGALGSLVMYGNPVMGLDDVWVVFEIEDGLLKAGPNGVDGFEGVVLEDLLAAACCCT